MPDKTTQPPAAPQGGPEAPEGGKLAERVDGLEAEQKRQGGMLEQILSRLSGGSTAPAPSSPSAEAPDIARLVREGIAELEGKKQAEAEGQANRTAREEHAARLAALEERVPAEREDTAPGRARAAVQRIVFGLEPHK